jgi:hypothetical protein
MRERTMLIEKFIALILQITKMKLNKKPSYLFISSIGINNINGTCFVVVSVSHVQYWRLWWWCNCCKIVNPSNLAVSAINYRCQRYAMSWRGHKPSSLNILSNHHSMSRPPPARKIIVLYIYIIYTIILRVGGGAYLLNA